MSNKIKHSGVIERIEGDSVQVRIVQTSACAACKVAGHCNASESKEKIVDVLHTDVSRFHVGDAVLVVASTQVAYHALLMGFGIPLLILVGILVALLQITGNEATAALSALAALVPYYAVLYMMRNRIRDKLAFSIEEQA
jgi:sigma-E factor negative regulatory protein RseC